MLNHIIIDLICKTELLLNSIWQYLYSCYSMCGFRLNFPDCSSLCIGTYLTTAKIPGAWILTPEEVDPNLCYYPLITKSG